MYDFRRWVGEDSADIYTIYYKTNDWVIEDFGEGEMRVTIKKDDLSSIECEYKNKKPKEIVRATCILEFEYNEEIEVDWY